MAARVSHVGIIGQPANWDGEGVGVVSYQKMAGDKM
jgi:hypothetical protein